MNIFQPYWGEIYNMFHTRPTFTRECSDGVETKKWVTTKENDKLYLYKQDDNNYLSFGECLMSKLSKQIGFSCVNCKMAADPLSKHRGVLVEDYTIWADDIKTVSMRDILRYSHDRYDDIYRDYSLEEWMKNNNKVGFIFAPDMRNKLATISLVDFLFGQVDRHTKNIEFYAKPTKVEEMYTITPVPMFDNGRILGLQKTEEQLDVKEDVKNDTPKFGILARENGEGTNSYDKVSKGLAKEILKDEKLKETFNKFTKLDIKKEIEDLCENGKYPFSGKRKEYMANFFEERLEIVKESIKEEIKQSDETYNKEQEENEVYM